MNYESLIELISDPDMLPQRRKHYGMFYAEVVDNKDPLLLGRLKVRTPHYINTPESMIPWASYSSPGGGGSDGVGFYFIPTIGSQVCVSFICGDPEFPVWLGAVPSAPGEVAETHVSKLDPTSPYGQTVQEWDFTKFNSITTPSGHRIVLDDNVISDVNVKRILIESSAGHFLRMIESKDLAVAGSKALLEIGTVRGDKSILRRLALDDDAEKITITGPDQADNNVHEIEINSADDFIRAKTSRGYTLVLDDQNEKIELFTTKEGNGRAHSISLSNRDKRFEIKTHDERFGLISVDTAGGFMGMFGTPQVSWDPSSQQRPENVATASIKIDRRPELTGQTSGPVIILAAGEDIIGSNGILFDPGSEGQRPQSVIIYGAGNPQGTGLPTGFQDGIWLVSKSKGSSSPSGQIKIGRSDGRHSIILTPTDSKISIFSRDEIYQEATGAHRVMSLEALLQGVSSAEIRTGNGNGTASIRLISTSIMMSGPTVHDYFRHYHEIPMTGPNGAGSTNAQRWQVILVGSLPALAGTPQLFVEEFIPGGVVSTTFPKP